MQGSSLRGCYYCYYMNWNVLNTTQPQRFDEIVKILLENRGLKTQKQLEEFLNPKRPFDFTARDLGLNSEEIGKAVKRIKQAIKNNESIIVYGDYDADGICATAILWETLYKLTKNVLPYIPERVSEGYGLNKKSIENCKLKIENLKLIITVDHGITANEKIKYAKKLGIDVIVCDHHQMGKSKPECAAVVHTDKVCATAITWFLARRILSARDIETPRKILSDFLDLVGIATIADLEVLLGANRSFAKHGLEALRKTKRCGLQAIYKEAGIKPEQIGTYEVGYIIAPRLNAMGRMEHALESLRLLCTKDPLRANSLAAKLGLTNRERQLLTEETVKQAIEMSNVKCQMSKLIFIGHESYEQGIIGLVAGKLVEEYHRPAVVLSRGEKYSKASARSINGFNIIEAIRMHSDLLVDAGGHPMAAGFTIETTKIESLKQKLQEMAEKQIPSELLEKTLRIDLELLLEGVSLKLYEGIRQMSPFGLGNPEPVFASRVIVKNFRAVGSEGKHLKLIVSSPPNTPNPPTGGPNLPNYPAIAFNLGYLAGKLKIDQEVQVAYSLSLNEWNGEKRLELKIRDFRWRDLKCPN